MGLPAACATITVPKATYAVFEALVQYPTRSRPAELDLHRVVPVPGYEHSGSPDFEVYKGEAGEATAARYGYR
jgi:predicted transcriptional regulator YdeE